MGILASIFTTISESVKKSASSAKETRIACEKESRMAVEEAMKSLKTPEEREIYRKLMNGEEIYSEDEKKKINALTGRKK